MFSSLWERTNISFISGHFSWIREKSPARLSSRICNIYRRHFLDLQDCSSQQLKPFTSTSMNPAILQRPPKKRAPSNQVSIKSSYLPLSWLQLLFQLARFWIHTESETWSISNTKKWKFFQFSSKLQPLNTIDVFQLYCTLMKQILAYSSWSHCSHRLHLLFYVLAVLLCSLIVPLFHSLVFVSLRVLYRSSTSAYFPSDYYLFSHQSFFLPFMIRQYDIDLALVFNVQWSNPIVKNRVTLLAQFGAWFYD